MAGKCYTFTLLGDIMLGRLIDQLLPEHVHELEEARHAASLRRTYGGLQDYSHFSPWGNTLQFLRSSDLVLGNLETAVTTHEKRWPHKVFNYRMHPANIECLKVAGVDYVSLANNHSLDFAREGLHETVRVLEQAGIAYAGAGRTIAEAEKPAILRLGRPDTSSKGEPEAHEVHLYSFSDHPSDWSSVSEFNLLQYDSRSRVRIKDLLTKQHPGLAPEPSLKIVSVHWGPNYSWEPSEDIVSLAHYFVDECAVDVVHGHSSHHVQGVEVYKGKLIIFGCGDFVDDYAVNSQYRNDLSAAWNVTVVETSSKKLEVAKLEVFPNKIKSFQAGLLPNGDPDHDFVCERLRTLSGNFGTSVKEEVGEKGQLIVGVQSSDS